MQEKGQVRGKVQEQGKCQCEGEGDGQGSNTGTGPTPGQEGPRSSIIVIDSSNLDEGIDTRGDGALVGQVPRYPALVLRGRTTDERGVVDQTVSAVAGRGGRGRGGGGERGGGEGILAGMLLNDVHGGRSNFIIREHMSDRSKEVH